MKKFLLILAGLLCLSPALAEEKPKGLDPVVLAQWQKNMDYGISAQRIDTIKAISQNKSKEAYYLIEKALTSDQNSGVRGEAAYTLINLKQDNAQVWLQALKSEKDTEVLRRIVFGISELKIASAGPQLYIIMTNYVSNPKESYLTASAIRAMGELSYKTAGKAIFSLLTNLEMSPEIRSASAIAMGTLGGADEMKEVRYLVDNPGEDKAVRMYCAYALGKSGDKQYIDLLFNLIANEKEDLYIRLWAIAGLEFIKDPVVSDKLIELTKVDHKQVRGKAIETLGKMKETKAKEILIYKAKFDPDFEVQKAAKKALVDMGYDLDEIAKKEKEAQQEKEKQKEMMMNKK